METLPVLDRVDKVEIPTKKMTLTQAKGYREYAESVYQTVRKMVIDIKSIKLNKFEKENKSKLIDKAIKETGADLWAKKFSGIKEECEEANSKVDKIIEKYTEKIEKLRIEKESLLASHKQDVLISINERFKGLVVEMLEDKKLSGKPYRSSDVDIDGCYIRWHGATSEDEIFVDYYKVETELRELSKPVVREFDVALDELKVMHQSLTEIMMFDETRMDEAFQKLFAFRKSVEEVYRQTKLEDENE